MECSDGGTYILYSAPHSLYAGRARAYLIKRCIPFEERSVGHSSFTEIKPIGKLPTIPTLVTPNGEVIRDGAAIIDHFESTFGRLFRPISPLQDMVSSLFDVIGSEGLRRPAMHYRWNFPEDNDEFLHYHFFSLFRPDTPDREQKTISVMEMLRTTTKMRGVTGDTKDLVEALYIELLDALNSHFQHTPYLLGGSPCIGDFGMLAPLYGHLARDPKPATLMKKRAPRVYRWVERMNRASQDAPEYFDCGTDFFQNDGIPETLMAVLRVVSQDFVPETIASAKFLNLWLSEQNPETGTPAIFQLGTSPLGSVEFQVRDHTINAAIVPYRHFQLQRI
ncbi:MAG: glutathione S-transferase family protein, partial [SAR92 clade bacterium]